MSHFAPLVVSLMDVVKKLAALRGVLMTAGLVSLLNMNGTAFGQSNVVFMAADVSPGTTSKLVRFDSGAETFAVAPSGTHFFNAVAVLNGELLVTDSGPDAIQRFAPNGAYLGIFADTSSSSLGSPLYLETDSSGNVYAMLDRPLDPGYPRRGVRYNSSGVLTSISFGVGEGIDADADGNVYVAGGGFLTKYAPNATLLNSTSLGSIRPADISIDEANKRLYLADLRTVSGGIRIFDISSAAPSLIGSIATPANANLLGIHFATESGNILVTDLGFLGSNDPRGLEYSPSGVLLREYRPAGTQAALDITTLPVVTTDYNHNGVWDAADYVLWRNGDSAADGTGNGIVDGDDYQFWRQRFGQSSYVPAAAATASNAAIPEPTTFSSIAIGMLALLMCAPCPSVQPARRGPRPFCCTAGATRT